MVIISRKASEVTELERVLRITSFLLQFILLIFIRNNMIKKEGYHDEIVTSLSDYAIIVKKIPKQKHIKAKFTNFLENGFSKSYKIEEFIYLPDLKDLEKEKVKLIEKIN